jgi:uncharacterized protein
MSGDGPIRGIFLGPDDAPYEYHGGNLLHNLLLFGRVCKALGMDVNSGRMIEAAQGLELVGLVNREDVYHALRAVIVTRRRDLELFDEAFNLFWRRPAEGYTTLDLRSIGEQRLRRKTQFLPPSGTEPDDEEARPGKPPVDPTLIAIVPTYSQMDALRHKDFAEMTGEEMDAAKRLIARLPNALGLRKTRRHKSGKGTQVDARRSFRRNMRYMGEPLELPTQTPRYKPRPVVLICDISGSMERYTRILLHFIHTLATSAYQVESFLFSTRLNYISHHIRHKSVDLALREVGQRVSDWGGGTKTGEALRDFNFHWSRRVLGRGAIVMLITDGWDRGDPDILGTELARLQRSCHRLIWLNPLLGGDDYEPLTRGAQAMLPHVDDFLPVRNLANLEAIARELQNVDWKRAAR